MDIFNLCVTSRIVSAFFCSFTFLRFRVVPSSFLLEFHFGSCSELVILHYSGVLFLSLPSFGSPCFPLSSFFVLLSFCLFHFHFHFYFTAYGWFFTFVSLFYQRISVAGEVNTKRHTSKWHIYIETPGVLVDPRRRYNNFCICPGVPLGYLALPA